MNSRLRRNVLPLILPLVVLGVWWIVSQGSTSPFYPPLSAIFKAFANTWLFSHLGSDVWPTFYRFAVGLLAATIIGVVLGVALGLVPPARRAMEPLLEFFRAVPAPAITPLASIIFGIGDSEIIFVVAFGSLWPILLNVIDGVRAISPDVHAMTRVYRIRRRDKLFRVVLPGASPQIFAGLRIALAYALLLVVLAEMIDAPSGVGHFIILSQTDFLLSDMWAGILMLGILAYFINSLFLAVENRLLYWYHGYRAAAVGGSVGGRRMRPAPRGLASRLNTRRP